MDQVLPASCHWLGSRDYLPTWRAMQHFTATRTPQTRDEIWLLEHPAVYTLGQASLSEHLLDTAPTIPIIHTDRGGQVTYHGPGQLVAYTLLDITRRGCGVKRLVKILEQAVINLLADYGIVAYARAQAPGVYVKNAKIAFLGLRIRHGRAYHGLALNVAMDLAPFAQINPCGYPGLAVTQLSELGGPDNIREVARVLAIHLTDQLSGNRSIN